MQRIFRWVFVPAGLLWTCATGQHNVAHSARDELREHRKVAVLQVQVTIASEPGTSITELVWQSLDSTNYPISNDFAADMKNAAARRQQTHEKEAVRRAAALENDLINLVNTRLLARGFAPLDRAATLALLKEQSLYQTGLFDDVNSLRLGRLATADAILVSTVNVNIKGAYSPEYEIIFKAKLLAVSTGKILAIGEGAYSSKTLSRDALTTPISAWFAGIPRLD